MKNHLTAFALALLLGSVAVLGVCLPQSAGAAQRSPSLARMLPVTRGVTLAYHDGLTRVLTDVIPVGNRQSSSGMQSTDFAEQSTVSDTLYYRTYVQFDTSAIRSDSTILSASLVFHVDHFEYQGTVSPGELVDCGIYQVAAPWPVDEPWTWTDNPPLTATNAYVPIAFDQRGFYTVEVTSLVQAWTDGQPNYGLMIGTHPDPDGVARLTAIINSAGAISETLRPRLMVNWQPNKYETYLPLISHANDMRPDLVVTAVTLNPTQGLTTATPITLTVTIRNTGQSAATGFWVDLYTDPNREPAAGEPWSALCEPAWPNADCYGGAWFVDATLQPGQTFTLTTATLIGHPEHSHWTGFLVTPGAHALYAYVDSWNPASTVGAIPETNEANNRLGPLTVTVNPALALHYQSSDWSAVRVPRPARP